MYVLQDLARLSRPQYLILAGLTYVLGTGIARYLGIPWRASAFWLGLGGVALAQMAMNLLAEAFRPAHEWPSGGNNLAFQGSLRDGALYISIGGLAVCALLALVLVKENGLDPQTFVVIGLSLLVTLFYALPPLRLLDRGFGEMLLAIQIAYLAPSIGFVLQTQNSHGLLNAVIVPLTVLALAMFLVLDFPAYADDIQLGRRTLLTRLGWEAAVPMHHGMLIATYVLFGSAAVLGFSLRLLWPAFLSLPFAFFQYRMLQNIALGAKPIWGLVRVNAFAVFGLTVYFLTLNFWTR
jgi:1,4-dihydroxy-2-naphthoate octaprenyltransferase